MSTRAIVVLVGIVLILAALLSPILGTLAAPVPAIGLVVGAVIGVRVARQVTEQTVSRALARGSVAVLVTLAVIFRTVLVGNQSDNAYLGISLLGLLLFLPAIPFLLASIVPNRLAAAWLTRCGLVLLWALGIPGLLMLGSGGALYLMSTPPGIYVDMRVPAYHVIGFLLLAGALYLVGYYWPRIPAPDRAGPPRDA